MLINEQILFFLTIFNPESGKNPHLKIKAAKLCNGIATGVKNKQVLLLRVCLRCLEELYHGVVCI